ncbi:NAD-dependent epimerase/dehydratase family protein [Flavobacterium sp.]|uniref:NAD-dependent epimerase/dehydratase family protein n=1 Tax=Flavobacterium sp. TaxID=239 RepID=UPI0025BC33D4|nr:NAD-dependent epimerase/dehydratase family protein [Flavobacterium sp.]
MKILLTGGSGFLGSFIKKEFSEKHHFFTLSRSNSNYIVSLENEVPVFKDKFDLVIHAAGKAHIVPKTDIEKKLFYSVNVLGTINLLKGLEKSSLPKEFVFISSVSVYGKEFGDKINENHALEAKDPYGLSKIEAEKIVEEWCRINNVICTILRLPLLVGKNPPGNLGAMLKAVKKGYYFNIDGGKARKSMVLIKDVTSFIFLAASTGGIYNLTDGVHPSFNELSFAISKKKSFSLPLRLAIVIGRIGDNLGRKAPLTSLKVKKITTDLCFDDSKARKMFNWKTQSVLYYIENEGLS